MTAKNIIAVFNLANRFDFETGADWYAAGERIGASLAEAYGITRAQAIGVIAALSPRNRWSRNVADAEALIKTYAIDPEAARDVKVCTFNANKAKALLILDSKGAGIHDVLAILSSPKLSEFFNCLVGYDDVCIDGHAYSIWVGDRITLANVPKISKKLRAEIKKDYKLAAQELGYPAYVVQAVTWNTWRRLHGVKN